MNYTLFTIGGDIPVLLIDLITSVLGLTCVFLAGRNSKYNFWVGYLYTFFLFLMFWNKNLYASLLLQPVSLGINILGHYRWTHPKKSEESSRDHTAGWLLSQLGNRWCVGLFPSDPRPYLDACVTVLILVAQFLSALKKWDCWVAWLLVNVTQMMLHISVGHVFMPIVSGLYLINGVVSLWGWYRLYKKKA